MTARIRLLVAASLVCGLGYVLLWRQPLEPAALIAAKGSGVGLLAIAAALSARTADGWLLALLLTMGAVGDVLLEIDLAAGASAFAVAHVVAITLYARNRRPSVAAGEWLVAALLVGFGTALPVILLGDRPEALPFGAYAMLLGAMAASAWLSRFPRSLVALGALLFLISDMLIAVRMARAMTALEEAVWLLYYAGQFLIFLGVKSAPSEMGRGTGRSPVEG